MNDFNWRVKYSLPPVYRGCKELEKEKRILVFETLGKVEQKVVCPVDVPHMSRICPISYKERDIYGASMERIWKLGCLEVPLLNPW